MNPEVAFLMQRYGLQRAQAEELLLRLSGQRGATIPAPIPLESMPLTSHTRELLPGPDTYDPEEFTPAPRRAQSIIIDRATGKVSYQPAPILIDPKTNKTATQAPARADWWTGYTRKDKQ